MKRILLTTKKILLICSFVFLVFLIMYMTAYAYLASQGITAPTVFGWGINAVVSGSMEPTIPTGSFVFIHEQDEYQIGDIVIYEKNGISIMHRIIFIYGETVVTQGDANSVPDEPIRTASIAGKVVLHIPYLGKIAMALRKPPVFMTVVFFLVTFKITEIYTDIRKKRKELDYEGF